MTAEWVVIMFETRTSQTRRRPMSHLTRIEERHRPDRWRDTIFILGALLLTALSIGSLTTKAAGRACTVTVIERVLEIGANGLDLRAALEGGRRSADRHHPGG